MHSSPACAVAHGYISSELEVQQLSEPRAPPPMVAITLRTVLTALMTPMAAAGLFMLLGPGLGLVALPAEEVEKMAGILKV